MNKNKNNFKIGVFGTCRVDDFNILDFIQILGKTKPGEIREYPYVYKNKNNIIINVRPLGYTTTSSDVLQNLTLAKNKEYKHITDPFIYKNIFLKHLGKSVIFDTDYKYLVIEICSIKKIINKKTNYIFPYIVEGDHDLNDFKIEKEAFDETIHNIINIKKLINCSGIILLPPIIKFNDKIIKGTHEDVDIDYVLNYRENIVERLKKTEKENKNIIFYDWNNDILEQGVGKMLINQFHFTDFGKKYISQKIMNLIYKIDNDKTNNFG